VLALVAVPGTAAATETRTGGTVIVEQGETVNQDLTATGGTIIIRGTVNGDVNAFGGNVYVNDTGTVNGHFEAFAGNVRVNGNVTQGMNAFGGNVVLGRSGSVGGFQAAGGNVVLDGTVRGTTEVNAGSFTVGPTAVLDGALRYNAQTFDRSPEATITGAVQPNTGSVQVTTGPLIPRWVSVVYSFLVSFLLGAVLLLLFPVFSSRVSGRGTRDPLRSGGVGLLTIVVVPIAVALLSITLIGIPLAILVAILFALLLWVASVYGAFTVGVWLLDLADAANRWGALVLGLLVIAVLSYVPFIGGAVQFLILLLGLGAVVYGLRGWYRERRAVPETTEPGPSEEPASCRLADRCPTSDALKVLAPDVRT